MNLRGALSVVLVLLLFAGSGAAAFEENVDTSNKASADVDRPLENHVKAFLNRFVPPLYEAFFSGKEDRTG